MVGNVAGMICDGAKIVCAMKTMTGVDTAFRSTNLGRLAQFSMAGVDAEILRIMQDKLRRA
jgi:L-cysteine desulfidase